MATQQGGLVATSQIPGGIHPMARHSQSSQCHGKGLGGTSCPHSQHSTDPKSRPLAPPQAAPADTSVLWAGKQLCDLFPRTQQPDIFIGACSRHSTAHTDPESSCAAAAPSTGCSGCPEHPSLSKNHFLAQSPPGHAAGAAVPQAGWAKLPSASALQCPPPISVQPE